MSNSAAKDIRTALKAAFPGFKFSVTTRPGTGSVTVRWTDGPASKAVDAVVSRFEAGSFDGSTDMYNYAPADPTTPNRAKFVFCSRSYSDGLAEKVRADIAATFQVAPVGYTLDRLVHQLLIHSDLSGGYHRVVWTNGTLGLAPAPSEAVAA